MVSIALATLAVLALVAGCWFMIQRQRRSSERQAILLTRALYFMDHMDASPAADATEEEQSIA